jgi:hypothetical protein
MVTQKVPSGRPHHSKSSRTSTPQEGRHLQIPLLQDIRNEGEDGVVEGIEGVEGVEKKGGVEREEG